MWGLPDAHAKSVQQVLPKTKLGEAIQYSLNQWEKLVRYSIIETAKANDLNVFEYVITCLDELSNPDANIEQLLPWQFAKR